MNEITYAKDWLGNIYHVGDLILYPAAVAHSTYMSMGRVKRIETHRKVDGERIRNRYWNYERKEYVDEDSFRVVVTPVRSSRYGIRPSDREVRIDIINNITKAFWV